MENNLKFVNEYNEQLLFEYNPATHTFMVKGYCAHTFFMEGSVTRQIEEYLDYHINSIPAKTTIRICLHKASYLDSKPFRFFKTYFSNLKAKKDIFFSLEIGNNHRLFSNIYNIAVPGFEVKVINGN